MINFEEIKQQLDPKDLLDKMKSIAGGDLLEIEKLIEKNVAFPVSISEQSSADGVSGINKVESFNLTQSFAVDNQLFAVDRILERIKKIVEFIRFPEYPQEMQQVLGEINRLVRFTRHYSILAPDIAFCQKHSIFVVKSNTSMSSEFAYVLPLAYKPVSVNGIRILSPMPSKRLFLVIPCFSNLKRAEDRNDNHRTLSYSINKDNIRVVTSGGRSFRTYHSFYYRGSMRVHIGVLGEEMDSPYNIIDVRDQIQNFLNDIKTDQVGGIPKGYPAISDIVLEGGVTSETNISAENEDLYLREASPWNESGAVNLGLEMMEVVSSLELENDVLDVSDSIISVPNDLERDLMGRSLDMGWSLDDEIDIGENN